MLRYRQTGKPQHHRLKLYYESTIAEIFPLLLNILDAESDGVTDWYFTQKFRSWHLWRGVGWSVFLTEITVYLTLCLTGHWRRQLWGHWGTCPGRPRPSTVFWSLLRAAHILTMTLDSIYGCLPRKSILTYNFVTVYSMNFMTFCVSPFNCAICSYSFMPLLAPNPGDATVIDR